MGRAAAGVDVGAGGRGADLEPLDLGAEPVQHPRRGVGRRPVAAVDDHAEPVEPAPLQDGEQVGLVLPERAAVDPGGPDRRPVHPGRIGPAGQQGVELGFDAGLDLVGQLAAAGGEELDPVVGE